MAKTTKTGKNVAAAAAVQPTGAASAGGVIRGIPPELPKKKRGLDDLLDRASKVASEAPKKDDKKDDKPIMELSPEFEEHLNLFVEAREIHELSEEKQGNHSDALKEECFRLYIEKFWTSKIVPVNPMITTYRDPARRVRHNSAIFVVKATYKPGGQIPKPQNREPGKEPRDYLFDFLTLGDNGLSKTNANALIAHEIEFEKVLNIENLNHLSKGRFISSKWQPASPEQQAVVEKLLNVLFAETTSEMVENGVFTQDEQNLLIQQGEVNVKMRDAAGFMSRALSYVTNKHQLFHLLTIFKPELALSGVEFAQNAPATENSRLLAAQHVLSLDIPA